MTKTEIEQLMIKLIADETGLNSNEINKQSSFADLGIDSIRAIHLLDLLEKKIQITIDPYWFWEYPTVIEMSSFLEKIKK